MKKTFLILSLILAIFYNFLRSHKLFEFQKIFKHRFNLKKYELLYNNSQWVNPESKNPIGDDILYSYAGAKYILGEQIILINSEHPPLGKNLIGLSAIYLKNEYYFSIISGLIAIFSFYLLSLIIIKDKLVSFLLSLFLSFEPVFVANYFLTLLDLLTFSFLNFYFYFLIKSLNKNKNNLIFLSSFFLGLIISTKFFAIGIPIVLSTLIFLLLNKKLKIITKYLFGLIITIFIFVINYFQFFLGGNNLIDFLKLQKYVLNFNNQGRKDFIFLNNSLFLLLFKGEFYINLKTIVKENHFTIFWPISTLTTIVSFLIKKSNLLLTTWIIVYGFTQLISVTNVRYLILLIPYFYLNTIDFLLKGHNHKHL